MHTEIQPDKKETTPGSDGHRDGQVDSDHTPTTSRHIRDLGKNKSPSTRRRYSVISRGFEAQESKIASLGTRIASLEEEVGRLSRGKKRKAIPNPNKRFMTLAEALVASDAISEPNESIERADAVEDVIEVGGMEEDEMSNSEEEELTVSNILDLNSRGFPSRHRDVEEIANRLLADRDASPVGKRWAINFIKRQPERKTHFQRKYDYQRAKCEDPIAIRNWFRLVQNTTAKYGVRSDDIWNFDETGFMRGVIPSDIVITSSERRKRPKSIQPGNREWVTAIQAINAEGQAIDPFIVVAGQYHLANWYRESNLSATWAIATTQNGWTDNEIGLE
ncbi:hypothetical protein HZ326_25608 [Fusarium oxysporum f. sp. albedinis]|nr:hypothetical protein HZ326_25608 [Fusarium oxysporum f. sp. albedinis]